MTWAAKRKLMYIGALVIFLAGAVGLPGFYYVYEAPTCSDGVQNQKELGVDCGGPCKLLCQSTALAPIVSWSRPFKVTEGSYNVIAYIDNPNVGSGARGVPYIFQLYDKDSILISERTGKTDIIPNKMFPVFESNVPAGKKIPVRAQFTFTAKPVWMTEDLLLPDVRIVDITLTDEDTQPHLDATIENPSIKTISKLPVVAILYDTKGNAVAASRTIVDYLPPKTSAPLVFTWSEPFGVEVSQREITPILFQATIK